MSTHPEVVFGTKFGPFLWTLDAKYLYDEAHILPTKWQYPMDLFDDL